MTEPLHPDIDAALRDDLVAISHWADPVAVPDPELLDAHEVRGKEPKDGFPWQRMLVAAAAVLVVFAGVWVITRRDDGDPFQPTPGGDGWVETAPAPLQPRNDARVVWTGAEFVVFGGTDQPECPMCDYAQYGETIRDAAAYNPSTKAWRTIAPLPDEASYVGQSAVLDGDVYWFSVRDPDVNSNGADMTLFRYDVDADTWSEMALPPEPLGPSTLTAIGNSLLLYPSTDEVGDFADWIWSPTGSQQGDVGVPGEWAKLPDDPFPQSYDRHYLDGVDSFLLFARSIASVSSAKPPTVLAATLFSGAWTTRAEGDQLVTPFVSDEGVAYAPLGGGADGGEVNNWGRTIPNGGSFGMAQGGWMPLPAPVPENLNGMIGRSSSFLGALNSTLLDVATGRYVTVPTLPDGLGDGFGQATAAGGSTFFTFGGTTGGLPTLGTGPTPAEWGVHARAFVWTTGDTAVPEPGPDSTPLPGTDPTTSTVPAGGQATAVWTWAPNASLQPEARELRLLVTRLGCSDGVTGDVLSADVAELDDKVIITTWVRALPPGDHTCPGNDAVPYTITLSEPLGGRFVYDGACLAGEATQTSFCEDGGIRLGAETTGDTTATDPSGTLAALATEALCDAAIDLLDANALSDTPKLVADLRALSTDGLPSDVLSGFRFAVTALESAYDANRVSQNGWDSGALSSFLTDTCGRGEISTYYVTP